MPSAWKLTQLFGNTASGLRGASESCATHTVTPSRGQRRGERVEFAQGLRRGYVQTASPGLLETIGPRRLRVEAEVFRANHQDGAGTLRGHCRPRNFPPCIADFYIPDAVGTIARQCPTPFPHSMHGTAESAQFARDIAAAYAEFGFVIIENHGIDKRLIDQCLDCFRSFFALPDAEKRRYKVPGGGGARGYTPFGIETAKGAKHHDLKEFWHVGRELPPGHPFNEVHGA